MGKFEDAYPNPLLSEEIDQFLQNADFKLGFPESIEFENEVGYKNVFVTKDKSHVYIHINPNKLRAYIVESISGKEVATKVYEINESHKKSQQSFENYLDNIFEELGIESIYLDYCQFC